MAEYVNLDILRDEILYDSEYDCDTINYFLGIVDSQPVITVVRCKDCDYWNKRTTNEKGFEICPVSGMEITEYDFCSYGEILSKWISVKDRLPKPEEEVLILAKSQRGYNTITTAMYEDGTITEDNSSWGWEDIDFDYDEENDACIIPCGWWEYRHYGESLNYAIDDEVTHWMPLPEPPKGEN